MYEGKVQWLPENYPAHYSTFFNDNEKDFKQSLMDFFADYSVPQKSTHNQSTFFLKYKQFSRHYTPLANELVTALDNLQLEEKENRDDDKQEWQLETKIKEYRKELIKQMLSEKRPFESSHLLRRIDYALGMIEERKKALNQVKENRNQL